jgi:hypothetical protein
LELQEVKRLVRVIWVTLSAILAVLSATVVALAVLSATVQARFPNKKVL